MFSNFLSKFIKPREYIALIVFTLCLLLFSSIIEIYYFMVKSHNPYLLFSLYLIFPSIVLPFYFVSIHKMKQHQMNYKELQYLFKDLFFIQILLAFIFYQVDTYIPIFFQILGMMWKFGIISILAAFVTGLHYIFLFAWILFILIPAYFIIYRKSAVRFEEKNITLETTFNKQYRTLFKQVINAPKIGKFK